MLPADLSLKYLKKLSWTTSLFWLGISLIVWMLGIGGSDLYALPALIGIIILFREIIIIDRPLPFIPLSFNTSILRKFKCYIPLTLKESRCSCFQCGRSSE